MILTGMFVVSVLSCYVQIYLILSAADYISLEVTPCTYCSFGIFWLN